MSMSKAYRDLVNRNKARQYAEEVTRSDQAVVRRTTGSGADYEKAVGLDLKKRDSVEYEKALGSYQHEKITPEQERYRRYFSR